MIKTMEELAEELCDFCPLSEDQRKCTVFNPEGCGGAYCEEAYDTYLEEMEDE